MKKKVLAVLLGGCMVAGLVAGCGSKDDGKATDGGDSGEGGGGYHFEVVVKSFQSTYWQAAITGVDEKAEELGVTVNKTGPNAESDIADQVQMLNNAINQNPDGIALAANSQDAVLEALQTALDKEIPVVCFDTGVPDAPEGSVIATIATDNEAAGAVAAENMYEVIKDTIANATKPVRIGEVNQDATSANISGRGMGFINKMKELIEADGKTVAVVGNQYYVDQVENNGDEGSADVIIEVAVPAQTTVELSATEASNIMNKEDTIAIFGSNQVTAEGVLTANQNLNVLAATPDEGIVGVGFDAGATLKAAVADGTRLTLYCKNDYDRDAIFQSTPLLEREVFEKTGIAYKIDAETAPDLSANLQTPSEAAELELFRQVFNAEPVGKNPVPSEESGDLNF